MVSNHSSFELMDATKMLRKIRPNLFMKELAAGLNFLTIQFVRLLTSSNLTRNLCYSFHKIKLLGITEHIEGKIERK